MIYNCHYEYMSFTLCLFMYIFLKTRYIHKASIKNFEKLILTTMTVIVFHVTLAYCAAAYERLPDVFCYAIGGMFLVAAVMNFNSYFEYCISYVNRTQSRRFVTIFYCASVIATVIAGGDHPGNTELEAHAGVDVPHGP